MVNDLNMCSPLSVSWEEFGISRRFVQYATIYNKKWLGRRVAGLFGLGRGMLLAGLFGSSVIPFYEEIVITFARSWHYEGVRMLGHTPYYIIGGEFLIVAGVAYLIAKYIDKRNPAFLGVVGGLWIFVSYAAAYNILG